MRKKRQRREERKIKKTEKNLNGINERKKQKNVSKYLNIKRKIRTKENKEGPKKETKK